MLHKYIVCVYSYIKTVLKVSIYNIYKFTLINTHYIPEIISHNSSHDSQLNKNLYIINIRHASAAIAISKFFCSTSLCKETRPDYVSITQGRPSRRATVPKGLRGPAKSESPFRWSLVPSGNPI